MPSPSSSFFACATELPITSIAHGNARAVRITGMLATSAVLDAASSAGTTAAASAVVAHSSTLLPQIMPLLPTIHRRCFKYGLH